jgi:threonine/homoserine/homoserine lactone efflux protein
LNRKIYLRRWRASQLAARPAFAKLTGRVAGSLLIAAGAGMAVQR